MIGQNGCLASCRPSMNKLNELLANSTIKIRQLPGLNKKKRTHYSMHPHPFEKQ